MSFRPLLCFHNGAWQLALAMAVNVVHFMVTTLVINEKVAKLQFPSAQFLHHPDDDDGPCNDLPFYTFALSQGNCLQAWKCRDLESTLLANFGISLVNTRDTFLTYSMLHVFGM